MPEFCVRRSGRRPLIFDGELLAESDGSRRGDREQTRWHDLAVYRTTAGRYVLAGAFRTRYQGEEDVHWAVLCDTPADVGHALASYDPCQGRFGYPVGDAYAERQARLLADLRVRWGAQTSEVLSGLRELAERIE